MTGREDDGVRTLPTEFGDLNDNSKRSVLSKMNDESVRSFYETSLTSKVLALPEMERRNAAAFSKRVSARVRQENAQDSMKHEAHYRVMEGLFEELYRLSETLKVDGYEKPREDEAGKVFVALDGRNPYDDDVLHDRMSSLRVPPYLLRKAFATSAFRVISKKASFRSVEPGDVVAFRGGERNSHVVGLYDGNGIVVLDGMENEFVPKSFVAFEPYPPTYWRNALYLGEFVNLNLRLRERSIAKLLGSARVDGYGRHSCSYAFEKNKWRCRIVFRSDAPIGEMVLRETLADLPLLVEVMESPDENLEYVFLSDIYQQRSREEREVKKTISTIFRELTANISRMTLGSRRRK